VDLGGREESTVLGYGRKVPAAWAAFANGSFGHMLDYDDTGGGHVSVTTIPVAFSLAEKLGGVSGQDFIAAVACGMDIQTRLARAIPIPDWTMTEGWFATQLFGYLSGSATAGRLMRLDAQQMANALGIAFNQMSGSRQMAVGEATHMRSMQAGFSGQGSVLAAQLAQRGIIGSKDVIEGRYGLFKTYVRTDEPDWDTIVGALGSRFPILETHAFKVWPACGYTRVTNAAALELRMQHGLDPEDIESVAIIGGTGGTRLLSEPLELKRRPKTSIDGKYSIPFTTAIMLSKGSVTLRDYTDAGLSDPAVLKMAERIRYRQGATPPRKGGSSAASIGTTTIEIRMSNGQGIRMHADKRSRGSFESGQRGIARAEVPGLRVVFREPDQRARYRTGDRPHRQTRGLARCGRHHQNVIRARISAVPGQYVPVNPHSSRTRGTARNPPWKRSYEKHHETRYCARSRRGNVFCIICRGHPATTGGLSIKANPRAGGLFPGRRRRLHNEVRRAEAHGALGTSGGSRQPDRCRRRNRGGAPGARSTGRLHAIRGR
jgi:2-methylcitrate dehydratase PrpD